MGKRLWRRSLALLAPLVGLLVAAGSPALAADQDGLVEAAKRQDWTAVRALVDAGAAVDQRQGDGATALHWAAYWNATDAARLLLEAGATPSAANDLGATPLWLACNNASGEMVDVLLEGGADANATLPSGETLLMTASRTGNADVVGMLLAHGAAVEPRERSHGQTALMWAVAQRHPAVVRQLLEAGAPVDDRSLVYPKVISSSGNADTSGVYEIAQGGYTPLLFAARHGDLESARLLVEAGAEVNDLAPMGTSALVVAAHSGHGDLGSYLLAQGADPNLAAAGYTALHAAVLRGDLALVEALMDHGADPDAKVARGTPARRVSTDWGISHSMIGSTPFWLAARFREPAIMRVLADGGADPDGASVGSTAVMAALQGGSTRGRFGVGSDRESEARRTIEAITLALDAGTDVNGTNRNGDTAMHLAASRRLEPVIELLAERGALLDVRNNRGQTPLTLALAGPQGLAALYNPGGGSPSTAALLRQLGATDEGIPSSGDDMPASGR